MIQALQRHLGTMQIINLSEQSAQWHWLEGAFADDRYQWSHYTSQSVRLPAPLRFNSARRWAAAYGAVAAARSEQSLLVSHGPAITAYGELAVRVQRRRPRHLAYTFNYTDLPTGAKRAVMARAFRGVSRFAVFSTFERRLYADYLDLPIDRFKMLHWAVNPPDTSGQDMPLVAGDYVCAIGSQARDYQLLMAAARELPRIRFVIVATRGSLSPGQRPDNVDVMYEVPLRSATNVLLHSRFMVLPLRDSQVPCGHVTLVSAMHLGKAIVATESEGISDYVQAGMNAVVSNPHDPLSLARQIQRLYEDPALCARLGAAGRCFATEHCTESVAIAYFRDYLEELAHAD